MSILSSHLGCGSFKVHEGSCRSRLSCVRYSAGLDFFSAGAVFTQGVHSVGFHGRTASYGPFFLRAVADDSEPGDVDDGDQKRDSSMGENGEGIHGSYLENLERMVGQDDSAFSGVDLATLIRKKYGRSYDVQLIKKEFMGRNLLAMNVMWKYMEQRSFPLTEEEYILRLDDVANTLKCWGAVSHIRNSLATVKVRPRIGKAVSIFIDMDESGGRANEWIYK